MTGKAGKTVIKRMEITYKALSGKASVLFGQTFTYEEILTLASVGTEGTDRVICDAGFHDRIIAMVSIAVLCPPIS